MSTTDEPTDAATAALPSSTTTIANLNPENYLPPDEYVARDEAFKARLAALRREEDACSRERDRLEAERARLAAEQRRLSDEDASRFGDCPLLAGRYALGRMLGRGGFSEVYEAVDLEGDLGSGGGSGGSGNGNNSRGGGGSSFASAGSSLPPASSASLDPSSAANANASNANTPYSSAPPGRKVAVKLHQLGASWPDARKAAYVRHAVREYGIHRELRHDAVVALFDIFEVDAGTFATVLELCEGGDLDAHLRAAAADAAGIGGGGGGAGGSGNSAVANTSVLGSLPEREARAIAAQVFSGLAYLASPPRRVIHYDLKPANILFDAAGRVKITDFGLSKVVEEGATRAGTELTSQVRDSFFWFCFS